MKIKIDEIRLVTILPDEGGDEVSLDDRNHTHAYRQYLQQLSKLEDQEIRDGWIRLSESHQQRDFPGRVFVPSRGDDATTHLPDFRYTWGDFMALSYTWGDPTEVRETWVNDLSMMVTVNIEACLRVLRGKQYIQ